MENSQRQPLVSEGIIMCKLQRWNHSEYIAFVYLEEILLAPSKTQNILGESQTRHILLSESFGA